MWLGEFPVIKNASEGHILYRREHDMAFTGCFYLLSIVVKNITGFWRSLQLFVDIIVLFWTNLIFWLVHLYKCLSWAPLIPPLPKYYVPIVPWTFYRSFFACKILKAETRMSDYVGTNLICTLWGLSCPFIWLKCLQT